LNLYKKFKIADKICHIANIKYKFKAKLISINFVKYKKNITEKYQNKSNLEPKVNSFEN